MLRPVDIAVAYYAAMLDQQAGAWSAADIRRDLGIPRATLSEYLGRLSQARIVRGKFVNRKILASLLPLLPSLVPTSPVGGEPVAGLPTGFAAPVFGGHFVSNALQVWELSDARVRGLPIAPLHPEIPERIARSDDLRRYALLAYLDAVRGGRAREVAHGVEGIRILCALPPSPGVFPQAAVGALMGALVGSILAGSAEALKGAAIGAVVGGGLALLAERSG